MKKQFRSFLVSSLLIVLTLVNFIGCDKKTEVKEKQNNQVSQVSFTDSAGNKITLQKKAERIISLAPSNTEIIYALGAEDLLVGVTNFCDFPEEAKKKEKVGDFFNPNIEKIISLKPDVVLSSSGIQAKTVESLKNAGITVVVFDPKSITDIKNDFMNAGKITGKNSQAEKLVKEIDMALDKVKKAIVKNPKVFFEINSEPLMGVGSDTFISDAIKICGGTNIGDLFGKNYPVVSVEKVVEENPEVYLLSKALPISSEDIKKRPGFANITCVQEGKIFTVNDDLIMRPGPRFAEGLLQLSEYIQGNSR